MAFWNKKKENKVDNTLKEYSGNNVVHSKRDIIEQRENKKNKEIILDGLKQLAHKMYTNNELYEFAVELETIIGKFKDMSDSNNPSAVIIDNFIYGSLKEAENYYNRGNYIAVMSSVSILKDFINDRFVCGDYYTNKTYQKLKVMHNKIYMHCQNLHSKYDELRKNTEKLMNKYNSDSLNIDKNHLYSEFSRNKEELKLMKSNNAKIDKTLILLKKSLQNIEINSTNHLFDDNFDLLDEMDKVLEISNTTTFDFAQIDKLNNKLDEINRKGTENDISISGDIVNSRNELPEKLSLDDL